MIELQIPKKTLQRLSWMICFTSCSMLPMINIYALTLKQAEHAAIKNSPEIEQSHAREQALEEQSVAVGQLADPKLIMGLNNMPVDTFNFTQENMTQLQVGLQETFPKGHSLKYKSLQKQAESQAESQQGKLTDINILRAVRLSWVSLYYWLSARQYIKDQQKIFKHLLSVTESMLANNKAQQKDVIRAQLELSNLNNRLLIMNQKVAIARVGLARWIGEDLAAQANPKRLPKWPLSPNYKLLKTQLDNHPELQKDQKFISSNQAGVSLAKQQFWPGLTVKTLYGYRGGNNMDGSDRSDFVTAQVSIDLPIFAAYKQSKQLDASENKLVSSQEKQAIDHLQLQKILKTQYEIWKETKKSSWVYRKQLLPESSQYAQATLISYQNNQTDFPTLANSYIRELETQLSSLKVNVENENAQVNLLYLQGK